MHFKERNQERKKPGVGKHPGITGKKNDLKYLHDWLFCKAKKICLFV
jgi:hypothetical protein